MEGQKAVHQPAALVKNLFFFFVLYSLAYAFFALVRNNPFWHPGDYGYLFQALRIEDNWREVFAQAPVKTFQPLVNLIFFTEFRLFGLDPWPYYQFNIFVHSLNAFVVYVIVFKLLKDRTIAVVSSLLFVFAVGNYGKAVMVVSGISDLVITFLSLVTLALYFKNELDNQGRLRSWYFAGTLLFFLLSLLSKATSFSILGCMLAFNVFFRVETKRRVLSGSFVTIAGFALVVVVAKLALLPEIPGWSDLLIFKLAVFRNFGSYLVRMVFPIHMSNLVTDSGVVVRLIYRIATEIRVFIFLCILSYSVFGFIFGNRVIRFFIAWTYITVLPFCFFKFPADWLNIRYLYLVSVGFNMILASGTALAARLLYQKAWRRFIPYLVPVSFVFLSQFIINHLDKGYERKASSPAMESVRQQFLRAYDEHHPPTP